VHCAAHVRNSLRKPCTATFAPELTHYAPHRLRIHRSAVNAWEYPDAMLTANIVVDLNRAPAQWRSEWLAAFHAWEAGSPHPSFDIDLVPAGAKHLAGSKRCQDDEFEGRDCRGWTPRIQPGRSARPDGAWRHNAGRR
jgi:hypothetical protein